MAPLRPILRLMWRDRTTTLMAMAVLAIGIGSSTALFSVINAVLLRPLPYPAADRLAVLRVVDPEFRDRYPSFPANAGHIAEWQRACRGCEDLAAIKTITVTLTGADEPEQLDTARVSANFFTFFGVQPVLGRSFLPEEDRPDRARVAVISHALWTRRFGSDRSVVGRSIFLDGISHQIVGVLPAAPSPVPDDLGGLVRLPPRVDVFRPAAFTAEELQSTGDFDYGVVARLRPGVTIDAIRAELDGIELDVSRRQQRQTPLHSLVEPLQDVVVRRARGPLFLLTGATAGVLLIVCVNVANLLIARQMHRRRDGAIRTALGASPQRLLQETLIDALAIAAGGGALGLLAAWGITRALASNASVVLPWLRDVAPDGRVLIVSVAITGFVGLIVGLIPALRNAASDPAEMLRSGSRSATDGLHGQRLRRLLVAGQSALTAALLVATALLLLSYARLLNVDKGFATSGVLTVDVALPATAYPSMEQQLQVVDRILDRMRALPGVQSAAVTSRLPLQGQGTVNALSLENDPRPVAARPLANYRYVSPEYFSTMGTPLIAGRTFLETDRGRKVVILSAEAARVLWPGQDPIGKHVKTGGSLGAVSEVVGIAANTRAVDLERTDVLFAYLPYWLRGPATASIALRTASDPGSMIAPAREAIWSVDRNIPIPRVRTMHDVVDAAVADRRIQLALMLLFGCDAAILAALGVYGVVSYSVASRGREMAIRAALGATPSAIRRQVIGEGLLPVGLGILGGLAASWPIGHAMATILFQVRPSEPVAIAGAVVVLLGAAVMACLGPARRAAASTLDPV